MDNGNDPPARIPFLMKNMIPTNSGLKNNVEVGTGICDELNFGSNTKAAVIRIGMMEMLKFAQSFYKGVEMATFLQSCGVADLITTCYGGNRKVAEAMVRTGKSTDVLEVEMLNGQKLQGPQCAKEVHVLLKEKGMEKDFPLFTAVYQICYEGVPPQKFLSKL